MISLHRTNKVSMLLFLECIDVFVVGVLPGIDNLRQEAALDEKRQRTIDCRSGRGVSFLSDANQQILRLKVPVIREDLFENGEPLRCEPQPSALEVLSKLLNEFGMNIPVTPSIFLHTH